MKEIIDILIYRLSDKSVLPVDIPRLIRDVLNIISYGEVFSLNRINQNLSVLGWGEQLLDEYLLELIFHLLETEGKYEVVLHNVH